MSTSVDIYGGKSAVRGVESTVDVELTSIVHNISGEGSRGEPSAVGKSRHHDPSTAPQTHKHGKKKSRSKKYELGTGPGSEDSAGGELYRVYCGSSLISSSSCSQWPQWCCWCWLVLCVCTEIYIITGVVYHICP